MKSCNEYSRLHPYTDTIYPYRQWVTAHNLAHLKTFDSREWGYAYDSEFNDRYYEEDVDGLLEQFEELGMPLEGWEFEFHCEPNPDYRP